MEKSKARLVILKKIEEKEKTGDWNTDVEDDPETIPLFPNKVDYLNKKISSKIATYFANKAGQSYYEKLIKRGQLIIKEVKGVENFLAVKSGAIITSNHFNVMDNYAIWRAIRPYVKKKQRLYKVIREGNYTNSPPPFGFILRHCNTLPLSSNRETMKNFMKAVEVLLNRGEKILVYPEEAMWWNYRKPRPLKNGAFQLATSNKVPVLPIFITMQDSQMLDSDGFFVQEYTINILPPIYADENLSRKENVEKMKQLNFELWKQTYEEFYKEKLNY